MNGLSSDWTPTRIQGETFAAVKLLIMDETSTTDAKYLSQSDVCLRHIIDIDVWFGGLHILLVGDWLQQLPIGLKIQTAQNI